ncbi:MAG: MtrB/PioB family outer membrane beta-barrel protein [Pseudomonadota bacterium]
MERNRSQQYRKRRLALVATGLLAWGTLQAETDPFAFSDETEAPAPAPAPRSEVIVQIGAVSRDNLQFGRFADPAEQGAFVTGGFRTTGDPLRRDFAWSLDLMDLGRDYRYLDLVFASAGGLSVDLGYQETSLSGNSSGFTPFSGGATLVLPSNWLAGVTTSDLALNSFPFTADNEARRKTLTADIGQAFGIWDIGGHFRLDDRAGTQIKGLAIYSNAANPQAVLLPVPVDESTLDVGLSLGLSAGRLALEGRALASRFDGGNRLVTWQNPYSSGLGAAVDYPTGVGGYAPAPDHDSLTLATTASLVLTPKIRVSLDAMTSETSQQEPLLPYTANSNLVVPAALPTEALGSDLKTSRLNAEIFSRLTARGSIRFRYRYDERRNEADRLPWQYVRGDGANQPAALFALFNRPLSNEEDLWTVEGRYRFPDKSRVSLTYDYTKTRRDYAAVDETETDQLTFVLAPYTGDRVRHRIEVVAADLSGGTYEWSRSFFTELAVDLINQVPDDQRWTNHPLLRQYHLANQESRSIAWSMTWTLSDTWQLQGLLKSRQVDFDRSELGLTDVNETNLNLSAQYSLSAFSGWLTLDYGDSGRNQAGRDFLGGLNKPANVVSPPLPEGSDPSRNYHIDQEGKRYSLDLGFEWRVSDRLKASSSYTYLHASEIYEVTVFGARDLVGGDLPAIDTDMHNLVSTLAFSPRPAMTLSLSHRYLRFADENWQLEGLRSDSIGKVLTLGQVNPNENVNMVTLGISARF